jgi:WD repeat-containing protein 70
MRHDNSDSEDEVRRSDSDDALGRYLPAAFGSKSKEVDIAAQIERSRRTVDSSVEEATRKQRASSPSGAGPSSDGEESGFSDDEDEYPTSHELVLKTHERAVTTLSVDSSGGRLATGSLDCTVKLHDFSSITLSTIRAFRSVDPWQTKASVASDSHPIHHVEFDPHGGSFILCVTAHPQAQILSRNGEVLSEFVKGDMYIRDMHNTKGHVGEVTTGTWHPTQRELCVTAGSDSSLRIWDINNKRGQKDIAVFKSKAAGTAGRTRMTAVAWGNASQHDSSLLVAAALDGSLVMYGGQGPYNRPAGEVREAHKPDTWTGGVDISSDGRMVVTRGGDGLIKLWDTRKFRDAVVSVDHASTSDKYPMTNIRYSPNSTSIITGSATGHLHILNPGNLQPEQVTPITPNEPLVVVEWHPKLNQIITGSANAQTHVLYNPELSTRGALDVMSRAPKRRHLDDNSALTTDQTLGLSGDAIIVPGSVPHVRNTQRGGNLGLTASGKSRDPMRPAVQQVTPFMRSQPDEKHIAENIPLSKMLHEDPREALLRYAEAAKKDPKFTKAWQNTQPVTQYAELSDEEGEDGPDRKRLKR